MEVRTGKRQEWHDERGWLRGGGVVPFRKTDPAWTLYGAFERPTLLWKRNFVSVDLIEVLQTHFFPLQMCQRFDFELNPRPVS